MENGVAVVDYPTYTNDVFLLTFVLALIAGVYLTMSVWQWARLVVWRIPPFEGVQLAVKHTRGSGYCLVRDPLGLKQRLLPKRFVAADSLSVDDLVVAHSIGTRVQKAKLLLWPIMFGIFFGLLMLSKTYVDPTLNSVY